MAKNKFCSCWHYFKRNRLYVKRFFRRFDEQITVKFNTWQWN